MKQIRSSMNKTALLFFLAMPLTALSQKHIYVRVIAGNYWMSDLRDVQKEIEASVGHASGEVRSFPVSVQGEVGFDFSVYDRLLRTIRLGGFLNYTQAQGSVTYSNFDGLLDFRQRIQRITLGSRVLYDLRERSSIYCKVGFGITSMAIETTVRTNSSHHEERSVFSTGGLVLEPGYQWRKTRDRFEFAFNAGYEFNINGKVWADDYYYIVDYRDRPLKIDLSGFRLGAGVSFKL